MPARRLRAPHIGSLIHLTGMLGCVVLGCGLAALGFALVLDVLSLRELLAQYGPGPFERVAMAARAHLEHGGAQAGELLTGLAGLFLVIGGGRGLTVARRSFSYRVAARPTSAHPPY